MAARDSESESDIEELEGDEFTGRDEVAPYMFEPETSGEESGSDVDSEENIDRLGGTEWCFPNYEVRSVATQTDTETESVPLQPENPEILEQTYTSTPVKLRPSSAGTNPIWSLPPVAVPSHLPIRNPLQQKSAGIVPSSGNDPEDVSDEEDDAHKFGNWEELVADLRGIDRNQLNSTLSVEEEVFGGHEEELQGQDELGQLETEQSDQPEPREEHQAASSQQQRMGELVSTCVNDKKGLVWVDLVIDLLKMIHGDTCHQKDCHRHLVYSTKFVGTGFLITWSCHLGHCPGKWRSQPLVKKMFVGNLLVAAGIVLSGNSFLKVEHFFRSVGLASITKDTFYRVQRLYVAPVVEEYWKEMQNKLLDKYGVEPVVVAGDGRSDSPGHSAQYCSYVFTDETKKVVLHSEVVDVREAGGKTPNMEKIGFERGMDFLMARLALKEVVTDAHVQISAVMKNSPKYSEVTHQHDVWHGAKGLVKKIRKIAQTGESRVLQTWIPSIKNHFWFSSKMCAGDEQVLKASFLGMLHHVTDEHSWVFGTDGRPGKCSHEELSDEERDKRWLEKGSVAHKALAAELTNRRFLQKLPYYRNFRHTGMLENFNNLILMYAPKHHSYSYTGYKLRTQLAMIDHNSHVSREQVTTTQGKPRYECCYSKNSGRFSAVPVMEKKKYAYMPELMAKVFMKRLCTEGRSLEQHVSLSEDDPRRIHPRISMLQRPSTDGLVEAHKSRFGSS